MNWSDFAGPVLAGIGAQFTPTNSANLWGQCAQEKTGLHPAPNSFVWWQWNNPLNTTRKWAGSVDVGAQPGAHDVQAYRSLADGVSATIATFLEAVPGVLPNGYDTLVESFRENLPACWWSETARDQLSTWGTGSSWCDYTPIGADVMAQLDTIENYVFRIYNLLTHNADTPAYPATPAQAGVQLAVKPDLDALKAALAALPGKIGAVPGTSVDLSPVLSAIADLKAHPVVASDPALVALVQDTHDRIAGLTLRVV